jgi:GntR family transcriptional regulator
MSASGIPGTWESSTERVPMTPAIAARLGAEPGDLAMRTVYTFLGDGQPVMLSVSWEPAALTSGTAIMLPEEGPHAGKGVVERMAVIGHRITHAEETVASRPALSSEAERLRIQPGGIVLTIARVYRTEERAVETADVVLPAERYVVTYDVPVR